MLSEERNGTVAFQLNSRLQSQRPLWECPHSVPQYLLFVGLLFQLDLEDPWVGKWVILHAERVQLPGEPSWLFRAVKVTCIGVLRRNKRCLHCPPAPPAGVTGAFPSWQPGSNPSVPPVGHMLLSILLSLQIFRVVFWG